MAHTLTPQQKAFFQTFGYLVLPGLLADDIADITAEFEAVFRDRGITHDPSQRTCVVPFIDQRERLCALLDDSRLDSLAAGLLGDDYNYIGSDGNYYTGDTSWHSDGFHHVGEYVKIALYAAAVRTGGIRLKN